MAYQIGDLVFRDWKIVRKIGNGASGTVYEIRKTGREVSLPAALKVMEIPQDPSVLEELDSIGMDDQTVTAYLRGIVDELIGEIKLMAEMKGAPHIVTIEDYDDQEIRSGGETRWIVLIRMELLQPLQAWQKEHDVTEADVWKLGTQMAEALQVLEDRAVIHRDIKPGNIFINQFGDFKLGDFGIARVSDKTSGVLSKKGTENYMAPEVYSGQNYNSTVDIYSLGLVLYRLLNRNRLPFYPLDRPFTDAERQQASVDRMTGRRALPSPANASQQFADIVLKMCAYEPSERYQTAEEVLNALQSIRPSDRVILPASEMPGRSGDNAGAFREPAGGHPDSAADGDLTGVVFSSWQGRNEPEKEPVVTHVDRRGRTQDKDKDNRSSASGPSDSPSADTSSMTPARPVRSHREEKRDSSESGSRRKVIIGISAAALVIALVFTVLRNASFRVDVENGNGAGKYKYHSEVDVTAQEIAGHTFTGWKAKGITLSSEEAESQSVSFRMPLRSVSLEAVYQANQYQVTVEHGSGSGSYEMDDTVVIKADPAPEGHQFSGWRVAGGGVTLEDPEGKETSFRVADENVKVEAEYQPLEYHLKVAGADGTGDYTFGDLVTVTAAEKATSTFSGWTVTQGKTDLSEEELQQNEISFHMPAGDLELAAVYTENEYKLTVKGGSGSGSYTAGETVEITADPAEDGYRFVSWNVKSGGAALEDKEEETTIFEMPGSNVKIVAEYEELPLPAEAVEETSPLESSEWEEGKKYYAQKLVEYRSQYSISPSANPFDGEVKGLCYATLAGANDKGYPYLILCWRNDNDYAFNTDMGRMYVYSYEIWSWNGSSIDLTASSYMEANRYWLSYADGVEYWTAWTYNGGIYDLIPLNALGSRRRFMQDPATAQCYYNDNVTDYDSYLGMCAWAECANSDSNMSLTRTTGYIDGNGDYVYIPSSIDDTYGELTGTKLSHEGAQENAWKSLYSNYMKKLGLKDNDDCGIGLAYLNDDEIPELLIKQRQNDLYYIIVTTDGTAISIAMAPYANLTAAERQNSFAFSAQPDDYSGFGYSLRIENGEFIWVQNGRFQVRTGTETVARYFWDGTEISGYDEYAGKIAELVSGGTAIVPAGNYNDAESQLSSLS